MFFRRRQNSVEVVLQKAKLYQQKYTFVEGDVITWKPGMKNLRRPAYGQPAVVLKVFAEPIVDSESDVSSIYYNRQCDLQIGLWDEVEEVFIVLHVEGQRFQPYNSEAVGT